MSRVFFEVNSREVRELLEKIKDIPGVLRPAVAKILARLKGRVQHYPPPPPNSTYVRTYKLQSSWHYRTVVRSNILGRVYSEGVDYVKWVQDGLTQAWMHQGRWDTAQDIAKQEEAQAAKELQAFMEGLLN